MAGWGTALFCPPMRNREPMLIISDKRRSYSSALLALLLTVPLAKAADRSIVMPSSPATTAFARYVDAAREPDPFGGSGPVAFSMSAVLPDLYKAGTVLAIRRSGDDIGKYLFA